MPLDLRKVITQVKNIEHGEASNDLDLRIESTFNLFNKAIKDQSNLLKKVLQTNHEGKAGFNFASPFLQTGENLDSTYSADFNFKTPHIVISTDGSQIIPSAHEISSTALINIGKIAIPYFSKDINVTLESDPTIYQSIDDLFPSTLEKKINDEDLISFERTIKEIEYSATIAKAYKKHNLPIVVILDGTLIHWHIEKFPSVYIESFLERFQNSLNELKSSEIPVASFISNSRSNDVINMLRIFNCPFDSVDCKNHCANINTKNLPCNPCSDYSPIMDRVLINKFFSNQENHPGQRSILFKSNSKILNLYNDDFKTLFFYINTGTEIARVEIPKYVAEDNNKLDLLHNIINIQCKAGFGYPVALSEAHLQAVVTKKDRDIFYELIKNHLIKTSKSQVRLSTKELRKRVSYV